MRSNAAACTEYGRRLLNLGRARRSTWTEAFGTDGALLLGAPDAAAGPVRIEGEWASRSQRG